MSKRVFLLTGVIMVVIAIVLGAFGAHALKSILIDYPEKLNSFVDMLHETTLKYN